MVLGCSISKSMTLIKRKWWKDENGRVRGGDGLVRG